LSDFFFILLIFPQSYFIIIMWAFRDVSIVFSFVFCPFQYLFYLFHQIYATLCIKEN